MYRIHGDDDAREPDKRPCQCIHCQAGHGAERMREIYVWNENVEAPDRECGYECRCVDCQARMRKTPLRQIRERVKCKLAGYSAEVRQLGHLYSGIAQDRVQMKGASRRVRDVAEIGDRVTATIEADRMQRIEDEHG